MTDQTEICLEELADLPEGARLLIDTRDESSISYGTIPGAVYIPDLMEQAERGILSKDRRLILFCMHGTGKNRRRPDACFFVMRMAAHSSQGWKSRICPAAGRVWPKTRAFIRTGTGRPLLPDLPPECYARFSGTQIYTFESSEPSSGGR